MSSNGTASTRRMDILSLPRRLFYSSWKTSNEFPSLSFSRRGVGKSPAIIPAALHPPGCEGKKQPATKYALSVTRVPPSNAPLFAPSRAVYLQSRKWLATVPPVLTVLQRSLIRLAGAVDRYI